LPPVGADMLQIKMIYSPINADDINAITGRYGVRQNLPAVAGNEGLGKIVAVGDKVKGFNVGDLVIPSKFGFGTWRTELVVNQNDVIQINPDGVPEEQLASISWGPLTAYRVLNDFVKLKEGDVIILNGASSSIGQCVIQLAKSRGIKTICLVRNQCFQNPTTIQYLGGIGATAIIDENSATSHTFRRQISDLQPPKLALDSVGGKSSTEMTRLLSEGGTYVVYGGLSPSPVVIPTGHLIFKDISFKGFFLTGWLNKSTNEEKKKVSEEIISFHKTGVFKSKHEQIPFEKFGEALEKSLSFTTSKVVLKM